MACRDIFLIDATSRGFSSFETMVKSGDFDRLLLRPHSAALQLAGQELSLLRVGRFALSVYFGPPSP
ncbi:MAG: ABC-2 family transporter protein [Candidatus Latescibacterota bacterium]|nr:ABC-2 family transporter protein [Candidatus Latescibacterota bacterium]